MPTGDHYTGRIYDDVETMDSVATPDMIEKLIEAFDMSQNLGTADGWHRVTGTTYHHSALLQTLRFRKDTDGNLIYDTRVKAATKDGTPNGESAFLPEKRLAELRASPSFFSQQLLDPTPKGTQVLNPEFLIDVSPNDIPQKLIKIMIVDQAGGRIDSRRADSWAIHCIGIVPYRDDLGASEFYLLDTVIEPMDNAKGVEKVVEVFLRNGRVRCIGIEKVGLSTTEIHVANALRAKGRNLTLENKGIVVLRPGGRSKEFRIEQNLAWLLNNGKLRMSSSIPVAYRHRIRLEMEKFPFWMDDAIDAFSYAPEMIKEHRFSFKAEIDEDKEQREWREYQKKKHQTNGWLLV